MMKLLAIIGISMSLGLNGYLFAHWQGAQAQVVALQQISQQQAEALTKTDIQQNLVLTSLIAKNEDLESQRNALETRLESSIAKVEQFFKKKANTSRYRAIRLAAYGTSKFAAASIPAAANVALGAAGLMDVLTLANLCDEMLSIEELVAEIQIDNKEISTSRENVCAQKVTNVVKSRAQSYIGDITQFAETTKNDFYRGIGTLSDDAKKIPDLLGKSVGGWIQLFDKKIEFDVCDWVGGDGVCEVLRSPFEAACSLSENKLYGCIKVY